MQPDVLLSQMAPEDPRRGRLSLPRQEVAQSAMPPLPIQRRHSARASDTSSEAAAEIERLKRKSDSLEAALRRARSLNTASSDGSSDMRGKIMELQQSLKEQQVRGLS